MGLSLLGKKFDPKNGFGNSLLATTNARSAHYMCWGVSGGKDIKTGDVLIRVFGPTNEYATRRINRAFSRVGRGGKGRHSETPPRTDTAGTVAKMEQWRQLRMREFPDDQRQWRNGEISAFQDKLTCIVMDETSSKATEGSVACVIRERYGITLRDKEEATAQ